MDDIQNLQLGEPLLRRAIERGIHEGQPLEDKVPPIKRLDGEVRMLGKVAFARGTYCEVWVGWRDEGGRKRGSEGVDRREVDVEKVSLSLVTPILLRWLFVGSIESTSNSQDAREGAQGSTFADSLSAARSSILLRPSEV